MNSVIARRSSFVRKCKNSLSRLLTSTSPLSLSVSILSSPMERIALRRPPLLSSPIHHHPHHLRCLRSLPLSLSTSSATSLRHRRNLPLPLRASSSIPLIKPEIQKIKESTGNASTNVGVKRVPFAISVGIGLAMQFLVPRPVEVSQQAWQLLAIFMSTVAGLVLGPLPVGAWAFLGLTTSVLTKTLTFSAAFSAFTDEVISL